MLRTIILLIFSLVLCENSSCYSFQDKRIVRSYLNNLNSKHEEQIKEKDHARIARNLVYKSKWASIGTISTDDAIKGFPMVNIMSIADGIRNGKSTGIIYFLSTTLDFTGKDLMVYNKTTLMISDDEDLNCSKGKTDPMEPTCPRVHFSGGIIKMNETFPDYELGMTSLVQLHPAAVNWIKAHVFTLCKVNIENIYVLDYYGGPHQVSTKEYYAAEPIYALRHKNSIGLSVKSLNDLKEPSLKSDVKIQIPRNRYKSVNIIL